VIPLLPSTRELWHLDRYVGAGPALNVPMAWLVDGEVDVAALSAAVDVVIARHESLRAALGESDGTPFMRVCAPPGGCLEVADVTEVDMPAHLRAFHSQEFDLAAGRPLAALLLRLPDATSVLAVTVHHIAVDAWSLDLIETDLTETYQRLRSGHTADATPRYALVDVLRDLADRRKPADVRYWQSTLEGVAADVRLPGATEDPAYRARRVTYQLRDDLVRRLDRVCREFDTTLFQAVFAAYVGTIGRWANADDVVLGVPTTARPMDLRQDTVLFATNVLPIRMRLSGDPSYADLLTAARRQLIDGIDHASLSLSEILRGMGATTGGDDLARLTALAVTYRTDPGRGLDLVGTTCTPYPVDPTHTLYRLACHIRKDGDAVRIELESRCLDTVQLDRLRQRLVRVLDRVTADPAAALSTWPTHLSDPVAPARGHGVPETVVDTFVRVAERCPDRVAVVDRVGEVTYRELLNQVRAVSAKLGSAGVRPGDAVAVGVNRGRATLSALLGVMHAGAVYLPVDLAWPRARVNTVLDDAGVRSVLTAEGRTFERRVEIAAWHDNPTDEPAPGAIATDPAYVLYTSGSTGTPKGVVVGHAALAGFIAAMRDLVKDVTRVLAATTTSFDLSLLELLVPVTMGATCVIADEDAVRDPVRLAELIAAQRVDLAQATPTMWAEVVDHMVGTLPVLISGGEALGAELRDRLLAVSDRAYNGYGPTEATIHATMWPLTRDRPVAIGVPVAENSVWVLDRWGRPCEPEAIGRLHIAGPRVALGYLGRPEQTAERFREGIPGVTADRAYDTGDLASWGVDGQLYLHGREDGQIKLRGFRIEPGEIEAVIKGVDGVAGAVVVPHVQGEAQRTLAAFVQPSTAEEDGLCERVRAALVDQLPEYMRPSTIQTVTTFPRTSSGKTDRVALARTVRPPSEEDGRAVSPVHAQLAEMFGTVLGVSRVAGAGNFFHLGGDSIGAARLIARCYGKFGVRVPFRSFTADPTVTGLARVISAELAGG
jgi:amino acid adenylation domain-containing protein